jgi:hypothetical protein
VRVGVEREGGYLEGIWTGCFDWREWVEEEGGLLVAMELSILLVMMRMWEESVGKCQDYVARHVETPTDKFAHQAENESICGVVLHLWVGGYRCTLNPFLFCKILA